MDGNAKAKICGASDIQTPTHFLYIQIKISNMPNLRVYEAHFIKKMTIGKNKFFHAIKDGFVRYADFDGCSTRAEFWYFNLFVFLVSLLFKSNETLNILSVLIFFIPNLSVLCRRLHDSNNSGWNFLWVCLPFVGWARLLYLCCLPSNRNYDNMYWMEDSQYKTIRNLNKVNNSGTTVNSVMPPKAEPIPPSTTNIIMPQNANQIMPQKDSEKILSMVFNMAEDGSNHFDMLLSKEGQFELIMFDIWFALEILKLGIDPDIIEKKIVSFLQVICKKFNFSQEEKTESLYTIRKLTNDWKKNNTLLYMFFIIDPLKVYADESVIEKKLSSVSKSDLVIFLKSFKEHQQWLLGEIKRIKTTF